MTESEYLENKLRGTGRTTNLIKNSPKKCLFVVANQVLANHFQKIANEMGRQDVLVTTLEYMFKYMVGGMDRSDIVFDHFLDLKKEHWDNLYGLRDRVRCLYRGNEMSKLEKLKKDLLLIQEGIDSTVSWSEYEILVNKYAPGFKVGLKGLLKAKEEIERLIEEEKDNISPVEKAKELYNEIGGWYALRNYIEELEKCLPWVILEPSGEKLKVSYHASPFVILCFTSEKDAKTYLETNKFPQNYKVARWEGE